jgi:regulatory protein
MKEINEDDYVKTIQTLAEKKLDTLRSERNKFTTMAKLRNYLAQKGYEYDYINDILRSTF